MDWVTHLPQRHCQLHKDYMNKKSKYCNAGLTIAFIALFCSFFIPLGFQLYSKHQEQEIRENKLLEDNCHKLANVFGLDSSNGTIRHLYPYRDNENVYCTIFDYNIEVDFPIVNDRTLSNTLNIIHRSMEFHYEVTKGHKKQ